MAASTASICLRRESLSVQVHMSSKDSSRFKVSPFVETYPPLYETLMTPPGVFVCWTDLVVSPATRTTLRSPVPPSRFSMRHESCRPLKSNSKRLGTRPLSTTWSSPTEQRPENVVWGSPSSRIRTSGLPSGSLPSVISGGDVSSVVSGPVVGGEVVSSVVSVLSLGGLFSLFAFLVLSEQ